MEYRIGKVFGKLTITEEFINSKSRRICKCVCVCGTVKNIRWDSLVNGTTKSCGCSRKEIMTHKAIVEGLGRKRKHHPRIATARTIWSDHYSDGCSFETFYSMSQQNCFYCGAAPSTVRNVFLRKYVMEKRGSSDESKRDGYFTYNGLDRIDSSGDHSSENIVSCCQTCNYAKRTMSQDQFFGWVIKIYKNLAKEFKW